MGLRIGELVYHPEYGGGELVGFSEFHDTAHVRFHIPPEGAQNVPYGVSLSDLRPAKIFEVVFVKEIRMEKRVRIAVGPSRASKESIDVELVAQHMRKHGVGNSDWSIHEQGLTFNVPWPVRGSTS